MQGLDHTEVIKRFVSTELNVDYCSLDMDTDLISDLGVAGDDGYEFMNRYCDEFKIDCSEFNIYAMFGSEELSLIGLLYWLIAPVLKLFGVNFYKEDNVVTVEHLVNGVIDGKIKTIQNSANKVLVHEGSQKQQKKGGRTKLTG